MTCRAVMILIGLFACKREKVESRGKSFPFPFIIENISVSQHGFEITCTAGAVHLYHNYCNQVEKLPENAFLRAS